MIQEVRVPEISENVESGAVTQVLVAAGDRVEKDQPLIEVETEKAAVEIPSPYAGQVTEVAVKSGDTVRVNQLIVKLETEQKEPAPEARRADVPAETGRRSPQGETSRAGAEARPKERPPTPPQPLGEEEPAEQPGPEQIPPAAGSGAEAARGEQARVPAAPAAPRAERRVEERREERREEPEAALPPAAEPGVAEPGAPAPASPSIRRLARELGVDIWQVRGSGPNGRITTEDVKGRVRRAMGGAAGEGAPRGTAALAPGAALPDFSRWGEVERRPMSRVREITAGATAAAWTAVPHVTQFDRADVTELEQFRKRYGDRVEKAGGKLTVTSILVKVTAAALAAFPQFNTSLDVERSQIVYKKYIHIGIAVDTDRGLLVPVIRNADRKGIRELAVELTGMAERTRNKKIKPEEMEGGTFTISNLGGIGGTGFTPIVYHPQVAILGVARADWQPVVRDGGFEPRLILPLSLSYDHRVIDGADGARFLRWIAEALEHPLVLILEGGE